MMLANNKLQELYFFMQNSQIQEMVGEECLKKFQEIILQNFNFTSYDISM